MTQASELRVKVDTGLAWLYHVLGYHQKARQHGLDAAHSIRFVRRPLALLQLDRELNIVAQEIADAWPDDEEPV